MGPLNLVSGSFLVVILGVAATNFISVSGEKFTFGITQWGDIRSHMRLMQKDDLPEQCKSDGASKANCIGGIPQLLGYIDVIEKELKDSGTVENFRFATGNLVSGENGFLSLLDWKFFGDLLKNGNTALYHPDYMSLGIKEFEAGIPRTVNYLEAAGDTVKTVISNTNCPDDNDLAGDQGFCKKITKTAKLNVNGVDITIVGFVNPLANDLSEPDPVKFLDPADAIADAIKSVSTQSVIAIGTGNYDMAKSIIDKSSKIKLVIYGGGTKDLTSNYPAPYKSGYIATTGSKYGTKIGSLTLTVDDNSITKVTGKLRSLDSSSGVEEDDTAKTYLNDNIEKTNYSTPIVETRVRIDGASCWENECNLGNLVTDAMVHCAYNSDKVKALKSTDGIISVWHGGAFLNDTVEPGETIKIIDIHKWLPYHNNANFVKVTGATLWELFRLSATGLEENPNWGQFLQVSSGVEVKYKDNEVSQVLTVHTNNGMPQMEEIKDDAIYNLVIPSIMTKGKSVYKDLPGELLEIGDASVKYIHIDFDDECVSRYLMAMGTVSTGFEKRISLDDESVTGKCNKKTGLTVFLTLFITALILGGGYALWRFVIQPRRANGNCI